MNIFEKYLKLIINTVDKNILKLGIENTNEFKGVIVESPPVEFDFDLSCNICLILAKKNNQNPKRLAEEIKDLLLKNIKEISTIDIAGPGFLNIKLNDNAVKNIIEKIFSSGASYGSSKNNEKFNIEFVSANPTGPLHVGHCRGAIYGDVLANLLKFNGNIVTKEYYINDYGNQIINFTKSVFLRIRELKYNEKFTGGEDLYPGEYIIEISKKIISDLPNENFENLKSCYNLLSKKSLDYSMNLIKDDLKRLGIKHDNFFSESEIVNNKLVNKAVERLKQDKFVEEGYLEPPKGEDSVNWKKSKKLIFKSTLFADDADRALQKNDGSWTYFANDVAYHLNKISRNYDHLINVLGADHIGYIKRITAAVNALSKNKVKLDCKVCQLVKLFKDGKPFKMSKRAGDFISANDLLNEVNKDSIRFMMLSRSNDVELEFDFDKVLEKSKDNPVFYVQYSYARISSLVRTLKIDLKENLTFEKKFKLNQYEIRLLRKIFEWPKIVETSSKKFEPHRISYYLYELATLFHSYWSKGNENDEFKFVKDNKIKNFDTISIIKILAIVIENGMKILDISLPKKM